MFKYLEFLLPIHNCVIIPEFGGFIIDVKAASFQEDGKINPPQYDIIFNTELKHNDGTLASFFINNSNTTYNVACKSINDFVKVIKSDLKSGKIVVCGKIGILATDSMGNIIFSSNKDYIQPTLYGLYPTRIEQLTQIDRTSSEKRRVYAFKYIAGGVVASAAALLMFITPNASIKDNNYNKTQKADFISSVTSSLLSQHDIKKEMDAIYFQNEEKIEVPDVKPLRTYYIIIGGEETKGRVNHMLDKIQKTDFPYADIVETPEIYRIYVSSFDDKSQAEAFLDIFRKENPKYKTAWLYSKRNL